MKKTIEKFACFDMNKECEIKMIGFKVGKSRPTANKTIDLTKISNILLGDKLLEVLKKSDFVSIRRID